MGVAAVDSNASVNYLSGSNGFQSAGGAVYLHGSTEFGVYGSLMTAATESQAKIVNAIYASNVLAHASNTLGLVDLGYAARFTEAFWLDSRAFFSYGGSNVAAFTDSWGVQVNGISHGLTSFGLTEGLNYAFEKGTAAFLRGGVANVQDAQKISAFGLVHAGTASQTYETVEGGFNRSYGALGLGVSGFGSFSATSMGFGGLGHLSLVF